MIVIPFHTSDMIRIGPQEFLDDEDPTVVRRQVTIFDADVASIWGTSNVLYFDEPLPEQLAYKIHKTIKDNVPFELSDDIQIMGRDFT